MAEKHQVAITIVFSDWLAALLFAAMAKPVINAKLTPLINNFYL
jgi:hypothetical protein